MPHMRRKINVKVGWRGRKNFRKILKKINFDRTTEYVRHQEESDLLSSNFVVEICAPQPLTDVVCIVLIALGDKYGGSVQKRIDENPNRFDNTKEYIDRL